MVDDTCGLSSKGYVPAKYEKEKEGYVRDLRTYSRIKGACPVACLSLYPET
jgi:hypothetical protein